MKIFWKSMASLSLASAIFFSGFHMGGAGKAKTKAFTAVPEEQVYDRDSTIAIVNLDEGAWIGQEQVYYAKSLMQYNDADFVATSLEEARTALRMGKVGAYMIIPAGFSRTVESVNTSR